MSQLNVDTIKNRVGTAGPTTPSLNVTGSINAVSIAATNLTITGIITAPALTAQINSSGIATFSNGPVIIGSATSSGVFLQRLQVHRGSGYISDTLGIGISATNAKLHIAGMGNSVATAIRIDGADLFRRDVLFTEFNTTAYGGIVRYDSNADRLQLLTVTNNNERMGISINRDSGFVGICKTDPTTGLDVNGTITATNFGTVTNNAFGTRTVQSGGSPSGGVDGDIYYIY